jgi:hypothetical protein
MSKKMMAVAFVIALLAGFLIYNSDAMKERRIINALVAQNIEARGGANAWQAVNSLRLTGLMDLGQEMHVPYVVEKKRPGMFCIEFVFDGETAIQCVNGKTGWKQLPYLGRDKPEAMTDGEYSQLASTAAIEGLLSSAFERGYEVTLVGKEMVVGRMAVKLEVTLPDGTPRWLYIDEETGLDIKLESTRLLRGQERVVETFYYDWRETDGLLIPRRQESRTQGDDEFSLVTVDEVVSNPPLDDSRFAMPATEAGES